MAKAKPGQPTFIELDRPDLRNIGVDERRPAIAERRAADSLEAAVALIEEVLGFTGTEATMMVRPTPIGEVTISREKLAHIVEKRVDARERFVDLALDTLEHPFEVWEQMYDDDQIRYIFIGSYQQEYQMLVIVAPWEGRLLWNYMHSAAKKLNKHRNGTLIYVRT